MFQEDDLEYTPRLTIREPGESVQLQELGIGDAKALFEVVNYDPSHLRPFAPDLVRSVISEAAAITRLARKDAYKRRFGIWDEAVLRGEVDFMPKADGRAEVGYWVGGEHTGNNYASRATTLLARWAFRTLTSYDTLYARIRVENIPSQRAIIKSGFQFENEHEGWLRFVLSRDEIDLD